MKKIITIAKKEFLDTFRDKRTLIRMVLIPLLAFPLILQLVTTIQKNQSEKEAAKVLTIGYVNNGQGQEIINSIGNLDKYELKELSDSTAFKEAIEKEEINVGLYYPSGFESSFDKGETPKYYTFASIEKREELERFETVLEAQDSILLSKRMNSIGKSYEFTIPSELVNIPIGTKKMLLAKYAGGILPYIFIAFLFMGCMLPAIDMFAGEKERGTIETLLTSPVNRLHILLGKLVVITAMGLLSASVALIGLIVSLKMMDTGDQAMQMINEMLTAQLFITLYVLLIPLAIFFAGVMVPISVYSKSFKEAQSILTPLNIVMVLPAMVGFIPGVELDYTTAFIPIVNVVLATKALIAEKFDLVLIIITFLSLIILAGISVLVSIKQFEKESNILR